MLYSSTSSFAATHSTEEDEEQTHPEIALSPVSPLSPTQGNTGNDILVAALGINYILYGTHKHKSTHTATDRMAQEPALLRWRCLTSSAMQEMEQEELFCIRTFQIKFHFN